MSAKDKAWTVSLGSYRNAHALRSALAVARVMQIGLAHELLHEKGFEVEQEERQVNLIVRSVEQLGFTSIESYERICARAEKRGFELCPAELGPSLAVQSGARLSPDVLYVGMQPMTDESGLRAIFGVGTLEGRVVLKGVYSAPRQLWNLQTRFVFMKPHITKGQRPATVADLAARF